MMSEDELELDNIGGYKKIYSKTGKETVDTQKTALFVIISDTDDSFNFIVALMYSQLFNLLCDRADDVYGGRLPIHVRCLIESCEYWSDTKAGKAHGNYSLPRDFRVFSASGSVATQESV